MGVVHNMFYHLGNYAQDENKMLDLAKDWVKTNI
jgi:hypothetical protein